MKRDFKPLPKKYETSWLGPKCSIGDGDYRVQKSPSLGINHIEFKKRAPFITRLQAEEFNCGLLHIVVTPTIVNDTCLYCRRETETIEAEHYDIWCPFRHYEVSKNTERGLLLSPSSLDINPIRISKAEAKKIFTGSAPFPCCSRYTIPATTIKRLKSNCSAIRDFRIEISEGISTTICAKTAKQ